MSLRALATLSFAALSTVLLMGNTWGGTWFTTTHAENEYGTVSAIDVDVKNVVAHPCNGDDPIFDSVSGAVDLMDDYDMEVPGSVEICRLDLVLDGFPSIVGTVNGDPVTETPAVDKLIFDVSGSTPEDARIHAGDFGRMSFSLTEI